MSKDKTGGPAWKPINGYPYIQISTNGEIRTLIDRRRKNPMLQAPRPLRASLDPHGYRIICLRDNNYKKKTHRICRLVLLTFVGHPPPQHQCCHNNGLKSDDRLVNLRWGTVSENTKDQVKHGVHRGLKSKGEKHPLAKLTRTQVIEIKELISKKWATKDIALKFNLPRTTVNSIKIGKSWAHIQPAT